LQDPKTPDEEHVMDLICKKYCVIGGTVGPDHRKFKLPRQK